MTKILVEYPPVFERVRDAFDLSGKNSVFAYDHTIYNPFLVGIDDFMLVHEEVHFNQQDKIGVDVWWDKYIADPQFRFDQELEAYRAQWMAISDSKGDRNWKDKYFRFLARTLAGPVYGNLVSVTKAGELIKSV